MEVNRGWSWSWILNYRGQSGQWAQALHRVTGLGVAFFLLLHIIDTAVLGWGPGAYNTLVNIWHMPLFRVFQIVLAACLIYHAANGIRVTLIDFWDKASLYQERLFWGTLVLFFVLFLPTAYFMLISLF